MSGVGGCLGRTGRCGAPGVHPHTHTPTHPHTHTGPSPEALMRYRLVLALSSLLVVGSGCRSARAPAAPAAPAAPPPVPVAAPSTGEPAPDERDPKEVRQAVKDLVRDAYPGSRLEGVFTLPFYSNLYLAGADISMGPQRRTVDLLVRKYVRDNGTEYWRAELYGPGSAALLARPDGGRQ